MHNKQEFLERYDNGYHFSDKELLFLVRCFQNVKTTLGRATQNSQEARTIISVGGRYFLIDWYIGLGDCDGDDFCCSPREVKKKEKTVIEWEEI